MRCPAVVFHNKPVGRSGQCGKGRHRFRSDGQRIPVRGIPRVVSERADDGRARIGIRFFLAWRCAVRRFGFADRGSGSRLADAVSDFGPRRGVRGRQVQRRQQPRDCGQRQTRFEHLEGQTSRANPDPRSCSRHRTGRRTRPVRGPQTENHRHRSHLIAARVHVSTCSGSSSPPAHPRRDPGLAEGPRSCPGSAQGTREVQSRHETIPERE